MSRPTSRPKTLRDVATSTGLAPATISRFLNGAIKLPDATAERIFAAVETLGYRPNPHARRLSRGRADMIGLAVPDIRIPFFARLAAAADHCAEAAQIGLVLRNTLSRPAHEIGTLDQLHNGDFDGLIFATNRPHDAGLAEAINGATGPIVIVDEDIEGVTVPKVFCDNRYGGVLAAQHLLEAGHRCLAYIGGPSALSAARERGEGFLATVEAAGASVSAALYGAYDAGHGRAAMEEILAADLQTTAVFAGSDDILLGALGFLRERAMKVPADISFVAFDDMLPLELFDPPITAVRQPVDEIGAAAVRLLREDGAASARAAPLRLRPTLTVRGSVAAPRGKPAQTTNSGINAARRVRR